MPKQHPIPYRTAERSESGRPVYLYIVDHGGTLYHLTSLDEQVTVSGLPAGYGSSPQVFTPAQCSHGSIRQSVESRSADVSFSLGINRSPAAAALRAFFLTATAKEIQLTVARAHGGNLPTLAWSSDAYVEFKGVATGVSFVGQQINLSCTSLLLDGNRSVPRYFYQLTCQHMHFLDRGPGSCQADPTAVENHISTVLTAADRLSRTVDIAETTIDGDAITTDTFRSGVLVEMDGLEEVARLMVAGSTALPASAGTRLWLVGWSPSLEAGVAVDLLRGCPKTVAGCETFGQKANFGGHPYVPVINPAIHNPA